MMRMGARAATSLSSRIVAVVEGLVVARVVVADRGVVGFKAFLCDSGLPEFPRADDYTLYDGLRAAARLGLPVAVQQLTRYDIYSADEFFLTGTAAEVIAAVNLDGRVIGDGKPGPVARRVQELYRLEALSRAKTPAKAR